MTVTPRHLRLAWRLLLSLGVLYAAGMIAVAAYRARTPHVKGRGTSDYVTFYLTARHFLQTGQITSDAGVKNYLPFFPILMVPVAMLPCWLGAVLMAALSVGALVLSVAMMLRGLIPWHDSPPFLKVAVPILMTLPFLHACLVLGQVSILVTMLCLLAWWSLATGRPWAAGFPLALAVLIKPFLLSLVLFLGLKRQGRAVSGTLVWGVLLGAGLTFAVMKPQAWLDAHRDYYQRVLKGNTPLALIAKDKPQFARFSNQSLAMVLRRLLTPIPAGDSHKTFQVNLTRSTPRVVQVVYLIAAAALAAVTLVIGRHPLERIQPERAHFEFALFLLWGLLASPIVWTHYLPMAMYPLVLLTVQLMRDGDAGRRNRIGLAAWAFWIAATVSLVTELAAPPYLRAVGIHLWATVLLWGAMAGCAVRIRPIRP